MKVIELIERLQNVNPEAEIWVSTHNEANTVTYGLKDQVFEFNFKIFGLIYKIPLAILMIG